MSETGIPEQLPDTENLIDQFAMLIKTALIKNADSQAITAMIEHSLISGIPANHLYFSVFVPAAEKVWSAIQGESSNELIQKNISLIIGDQLPNLRKLLQTPSGPVACIKISSLDSDNQSWYTPALIDCLNHKGWICSDTVLQDLENPLASKAKQAKEPVVITTVTKAGLERVKAGLTANLRHLRIILTGPESKEAKKNFLASGLETEAYSISELADSTFHVLDGIKTEMALDLCLKNLGQGLLNARRLKNMTQQDLAKLSGLDRAYISSLENGRQNITIGALVKLGLALKLNLKDFFSTY